MQENQNLDYYFDDFNSGDEIEFSTVQCNRNKHMQCLVQNITLLSHHYLPLPTSTPYRSLRQTGHLADKTFLSIKIF